jgi:hypothetical protein
MSDVRAIKPQNFVELRVAIGMIKNVKVLTGFN